MFGNLKVNNSDSVNALMSLKQGNDIQGIKSGSSDFYTMVMNYNQETMRNDNNDRNALPDVSSSNTLNESAKSYDEREEYRIRTDEKFSPANDENVNRSSVASAGEENKAAGSNEAKSSAQGEKSDADKNEKNKEEIDDFLNSAAGELLSRKVTDLAKGSVKGSIEDFMKKFGKIAEEFLAAGKKKITPDKGLAIFSNGDKAGAHKETVSPLMSEFFDKLGRELSKMLSAKKGNEKIHSFSEKEIKEALGAVIEDVKKGKNRNNDRTDLRKVEHSEVRNDKKSEISSETLIVKKKEGGNESAADLNAGKERNSSRDNSSFNSAKTDFIGKNSLEKNDAAMKSPEFRQSLQEIIDKAKVSVKDSNNASFSVKLFPKDLGNVNISLLMENGVVSGKFLVDNNEARNMLLDNLGILKEQLAEAGIQVGEFNVNVNQGGERFASKGKGDEDSRPVSSVNRESEAAMVQYDNNSTAAHNGHINMVI